MKKPDQAEANVLSDACGWACWVFVNTNMPKSQVLKRASRRFGIPAAAIERAVLSTLGKDVMAERGERMKEQYMPRYAASNSRTARLCRQIDRHLRDL